MNKNDRIVLFLYTDFPKLGRFRSKLTSPGLQPKKKPSPGGEGFQNKLVSQLAKLLISRILNQRWGAVFKGVINGLLGHREIFVLSFREAAGFQIRTFFALFG